MGGKDADVVIVGAGISGLTAARTLHAKDPSLKLLVLEGKGNLHTRCMCNLTCVT